MLPSRGRPGQALLLTVGRELTAQDILRLETEAQSIERVGPPVLQRLRESHHIAARYLAAGKSVKETAILCDRTPQRIGDLTRDPMFSDLVEFYRNQTAEVTADAAERIQKKLVEVTELATDELLDRLEDPAKRAQMPTGEIRQILQTAGDRSAAPPKQTQPTVTVPAHITFNMGVRDIRPKEAPTPPAQTDDTQATNATIIEGVVEEKSDD